MSNKLAVFTKVDCPQCPAAKILAESLAADVDIDYYDLDVPEGMAKALKFGVRSLPTIILLSNNDEQTRWHYPELPTKEEVLKLV